MKKILWLLIIFATLPIYAQEIPNNLIEITPTNQNELEVLAILGSGQIYTVAWSSDGRHIATGGNGGLNLYDSREPEVPILRDPTSPRVQVVFSPDGQWVASADGRNVYLHDLNTGALVQTFSHNTDGQIEIPPSAGRERINLLTFSADSQFLITFAKEDMARMKRWDLRTGEAEELYATSDGISAMQFIEEENALIMRTAQGFERLDLPQTTISPVFNQCNGYEYRWGPLGYVPEAEQVICLKEDRNTQTFEIWDLFSNTLSYQVEFPYVPWQYWYYANFSPETETLASAHRREDTTSAVYIWDSAEASLELLTETNGMVNALEFSPDGQLLAIGGLDGVLQIWDVASRQIVHQVGVGHTTNITTLTFSQDGTQLVSASGIPSYYRQSLLDNSVWLWEIETLAGQQLWQDDTTITVAFYLDDTRLLIGSIDGDMVVYDIAKNRISHYLSNNDRITSGAVNNDQTLVALASNRSIHFWDISGEKPFVVNVIPKGAMQLRFSPDGQWLKDSRQRYWRIEQNGQLISEWTGSVPEFSEFDLLRDAYPVMAFNANHTLLATGNTEGIIRLWGIPQ